MNPRNKYGLFTAIGVLTILVMAAVMAWFFWQQLVPSEQQVIAALVKKHFPFLFGFWVVFIAAGLFVLDAVIHNYIIPTAEISSEVELIRTVNPDHRLKVAGAKNIEQLAASVNQWADDVQEMRKGMEARITRARAASEGEKNILAEFLTELPQGMVVCNVEGQILLYNKQAKQLLADSSETSNSDAEKGLYSGYMGIGRSIFSVLENAPLSYALDEIYLRLEKKSDLLSACFIVNHADRLLRIEATPVLDSMQAFNGFLLMLDDFTERLNEDRRLHTFWRDHSQSLHQSFNVLQASIPQDELNEPLQSEIERMTKLLDEADHAFVEQFGHSHWPMIDIDAAEFLEMLKYKVEESSDVTLDLAAVDEAVLQVLEDQRGDETEDTSLEGNEYIIRIDSYAFALTIRMLLKFMRTTLDQNHYKVVLHRTFQFVGIDLLWKGEPLTPGTISQLQEAQIAVGHEKLPFSIKEVLQNHKADLFVFQDVDANGFARLRLYLEAHEVSDSQPLRHAPILPEHRPVDFDFDLFKQTGFTTALDNEPLNQLTCTVFDTETTGLDPGAGDEIISIGAIRVVNGRLVASDYFDQLVNPQRGIPRESTRFHGITDEMVRDEPTMDTVLPQFSRYVANSILIAHNAAFDMRMLQNYEPSTGIKFNQPVLDTMLLSSVVHPSHKSHNLRAIAHRLGINIVGRHTALGDAMATARLFVKLLPLLAEQKIYTLKDAREASRKSYLSRLKY